MSSTKRGGQRHVSDYYVTPVSAILDFLKAILDLEEHKTVLPTPPGPSFKQALLYGPILDPAAGGSSDASMAYPDAIHRYTLREGYAPPLTTVDIRTDSRADVIADYLTWEPPSHLLYNLIITNPPFALAQDFIEKALQESEAWVVMLLRLNFFESRKRLPFWKAHMPLYAFVHSSRLSFTPDGKTDSIAYMHCVWHVAVHPPTTHLMVI